MKVGMMKNYVEIWTDGSCPLSSTDVPGGWAAVIVIPNKDPSLEAEVIRISGANAFTSNNRMELTAVIRGIQKSIQLDYYNLMIYTDSMYVVNICTKWMYSWKKKGWNNIIKTKKNIDLVKQLYNLFNDPNYYIEINWVKGHSGIEYNEMADELASRKSRSISNVYNNKDGLKSRGK